MGGGHDALLMLSLLSDGISGKQRALLMLSLPSDGISGGRFPDAIASSRWHRW